MTKGLEQDALLDVIDAIEGGYEFLLAYAAQGRHTDRDLGGPEGPRARLKAMVDAMQALPKLAREKAETKDAALLEWSAAFFDALERDAATAAAAIRLVLGAHDVSSQIIDNLNASIHLRALLTDLFLVDEALKSTGSSSS